MASTDTEKSYYATGRRKTSTARVWLMPGTGKMTVNQKDFLDYFGREVLKLLVEQPFETVDAIGKFDVIANVKGGGKSGQAGAILLGIARALIEYDPEHRPELKKMKFLTRDPREKERKKYGQPGARKRFQYSKR
ncbi:30S ribosomal protein S9 [candidate division LCP-89 bacterium B3_LCP]|uniref:Small ribosomal subunit protein uS9 n=1 Tax=candidate division LCP-89 bacterium B3_LCP TaxID=2012998 RepID=A0A532UXX0_UNCL8|nr:MAG: 30S ribosomal protein S9 [candidate division LCP-89 bacterium B3_LCP]